MTYVKFVEQLEELGYTIPEPPAEKRYSWNRYSEYARINYTPDKPYEPALSLIWSTGGVGGGNCWGGEPRPYSNDEAEPEWKSLVEILDHFCPNISYLKYRFLMTLVTSDSYCESEYYGNSRNYAVKLLKLQDLYNFLVENKLVNSDKE